MWWGYTYIDMGDVYVSRHTHKSLYRHLSLQLNLENYVELSNRKGFPYILTQLCDRQCDAFSLFTQGFPINQHH